MAVGCGSATEPAVKTEEARSGEILPEEIFGEDTSFYMKKKFILMFMITLVMGMTACSSESKEDSVSVETDFRQETDKEENTVCDPIAGIVEKYEGNTITIKNPDDDMLYYFSTENAQILEGFSTESAQEAEGDPSIAVGDKVEISYRGLIDFDEEHPDEAVKIVGITVE